MQNKDKKVVVSMIKELITIIIDNEYVVNTEKTVLARVIADPIINSKLRSFNGDIWELIELVGSDVYYVAGASITNAAEVIFNIFNNGNEEDGFKLMARGW